MPDLPSNTSTPEKIHAFGLADTEDDHFEFVLNTGPREFCHLVSHVFTERGPREHELAVIPSSLWSELNDRVVREITEEMDPSEFSSKKKPQLHPGRNVLSPLVGREFAVLLWALAESGAEAHAEAILHGWRELAREERWWLFSKASSLGQKTGRGWRHALYIALSHGRPELRVAEDLPVPVPAVKKKTRSRTASTSRRPRATKKVAATTR